MVPGSEGVGPVLSAGPAAEAIVAAIRRLNPGVETVDRGAYVRVLVPGRCVVTREAIEQELGRPFRLPGDLEAIMSSFRGKLTLSEREVAWAAA